MIMGYIYQSLLAINIDHNGVFNTICNKIIYEYMKMMYRSYLFFHKGSCMLRLCMTYVMNIRDEFVKNTHVVLSFVIMKWSYDALLPWSFVYSVTLLLVDQSRLSNHIEEQIKAENRSFFMQKWLEMNAMVGCPLFITKSELNAVRTSSWIMTRYRTCSWLVIYDTSMGLIWFVIDTDNNVISIRLNIHVTQDLQYGRRRFCSKIPLSLFFINMKVPYSAIPPWWCSYCASIQLLASQDKAITYMRF